MAALIRAEARAPRAQWRSNPFACSCQLAATAAAASASAAAACSSAVMLLLTGFFFLARCGRGSERSYTSTCPSVPAVATNGSSFDPKTTAVTRDPAA